MNHVEPHMPSHRRLIEFHSNELNSNDLADIWRNFQSGQKQYTWVHSFNNQLSLARLDRFYVFKYHLSLFRNCSIIPVGFSYHSLVFCSLSLSSVKAKSAYWHCYTNRIADCHFKDVFHYLWDDFRNTKYFVIAAVVEFC